MAENKSEHDHEIRQLNRAFHAVVLLAIVGELAVISPFVQWFIPNKEYHAVLDYMALLLLAWLPHLYYMLYVVPLMFHNKTTFLPIITFFSLVVGIGANWLLIPAFGVIGVCISTILIKVVGFILTYFICLQERIFFKQHYQLMKNHLAAMLVACMVLLTYWWNDYTAQVHRTWVNVVPLVVFVLFALLVFRRELQVIIGFFTRREKR
jgi:O-antigen/teichoic acid export membrane protein